MKAKGNIAWYCFFIHDKNSGVSTSLDDDYLYFHIRFALKKRVIPTDVLPIYCVLTRKVEPEWAKAVSIDEGGKFDVSLLKDESIEEVWRLMGEQSEWLLNLLNALKENVNIPVSHIKVSHIKGFLNNFTDMTALIMTRR